MKTIQCKQGDTSWLLARLGVVTASEISNLITPTGAIRKGEKVETYLYQKLAERVLGLTGSIPPTWAMDQGSLLETMAIPFLEFSFDWKIERVGFCLSDDGKVGCSPDGLIGEDGGVEIKCPQATNHVRYLTEGVVPEDYIAQVNFSLYVTGRKWWDFVSYNQHLPPLVVRTERNEQNMAAIARAAGDFIIRLDEAELKLRAMIDKYHQPK